MYGRLTTLATERRGKRKNMYFLCKTTQLRKSDTNMYSKKSNIKYKNKIITNSAFVCSYYKHINSFGKYVLNSDFKRAKRIFYSLSMVRFT